MTSEVLYSFMMTCGLHTRRYCVHVPSRHEGTMRMGSNHEQQHPRATDFRYKPLRFYNELVELHEGTFATGDYAISSDEPSPADFEAAKQMRALTTPAPDADGGVGADRDNSAERDTDDATEGLVASSSASTTPKAARAASTQRQSEDDTKKRRHWR